jgi:hypothetical protein
MQISYYLQIVCVRTAVIVTSNRLTSYGQRGRRWRWRWLCSIWYLSIAQNGLGTRITRVPYYQSLYSRRTLDKHLMQVKVLLTLGVRHIVAYIFQIHAGFMGVLYAQTTTGIHQMAASYSHKSRNILFFM